MSNINQLIILNEICYLVDLKYHTQPLISLFTEQQHDVLQNALNLHQSTFKNLLEVLGEQDFIALLEAAVEVVDLCPLSSDIAAIPDSIITAIKKELSHEN